MLSPARFGWNSGLGFATWLGCCGRKNCSNQAKGSPCANAGGLLARLSSNVTAGKHGGHRLWQKAASRNPPVQNFSSMNASLPHQCLDARGPLMAQVSHGRARLFLGRGSQPVCNRKSASRASGLTDKRSGGFAPVLLAPAFVDGTALWHGVIWSSPKSNESLCRLLEAVALVTTRLLRPFTRDT